MSEITVLVPIYNVEKYLRACLDSLRAQTFSDFEAICINDGSTDSSKAIIEEYVAQDDRFKLLDKPNSGYGASMNRGLQAATGTYVAILESDDTFEPFALELLHTAAVQHDADVVKADFWLYWSTPSERTEKFGVVDGCTTNCVIVPREEPAIFYKKPSIWSALYKRSFLRENDIWFQETPGASYQDSGFNFKVWSSTQRAVLLDDAILFYRQDNEQSSINSPSKVYCVCDEYAEMERWIARDEQRRGWVVPIMERMKFDSYLWNYDRLSEELGTEFLQTASAELKGDLETGKIDLGLFEPWMEADLLALIKSPARFKECRDGNAAPGKLNTFKHYYKLGGLPLIFKVLNYKRKAH